MSNNRRKHSRKPKYNHPFSDFTPKPKETGFDIYDPKIKQRMNMICSIIESSLKKNIPYEEVASKLLNEEMIYYKFLKCYIYEYNKRKKLARTLAIDSKEVNYYVDTDDKKALFEIYERYIKEKTKEQNKQELEEPDEPQ